MSKIFISHSSKDKKTAMAIANELLKHRLPVWLDTYELSFGESLYDKIFGNINLGNFAIVLLSENYNKTLWTTKEFRAILAKENESKAKVLIPIKIDETNLPLEIEDRLYLDLNNDFHIGIKKLICFFQNEGISLTNIPFNERQILLNINNFTDIDVNLLQSILFDQRLYNDYTFHRKQIFIDLQLIDQSIARIKENHPFDNTIIRETDTVDYLMSIIPDGVLIMLNRYKGNNNIELISHSIFWYCKAILESCYGIISKFLKDDDLSELGLKDRKFLIFPFSQCETYENFYNVKGWIKLEIWEKERSSNSVSVHVDNSCYAYRVLSENRFLHPTITEIFSSDFMYKYLIPQNVFKHVSDKLRKNTNILDEFDKYIVGLG